MILPLLEVAWLAWLLLVHWVGFIFCFCWLSYFCILLFDYIMLIFFDKKSVCNNGMRGRGNLLSVGFYGSNRGISMVLLVSDQS